MNRNRPIIPATARVVPRIALDANAELAQLLLEIEKLGGHTRHVSEDLQSAVAELVRAEKIQRATLWQSAELNPVRDALTGLGVEIISPHADKHEIARCDLGVTGVDAALPETGTLVLESSEEKPRAVSLLPRAHLAQLHPSALRADLHHVFAEFKQKNYLIFVTGPSRTADIELTLTIGVHGPQALYVWVT
jgi:L-lactate dehydrogenase complex protein LldG